MLRKLRDAWKQYWSTLPPSEVVDSVPESQWGDPQYLPKVGKARRAAFIEALTLLFSHLPPDQAQAQAQARARFLVRADEMNWALEDALLTYETDAECQALCACIALDWKAAEEFEWQARRLARAHGLPDTWASTGQGVDADFEGFGRWLAGHGMRLFEWTSDDNRHGVAVRADQADRLQALLKRLKIPLQAWPAA